MAENKLELAWAAGFFDGEGSTYVDSSLQGNHYYPRLRLGVVQSGETFNPPQVLVRFQKAVGDIGSINPIPRRRSNEKPAWQFKCQASVAEQVLDLLWPLPFGC